ncbi:TRAP transporter substrate-binding protein DctP [Variovorax sp. KK3]|uniref:TRAP transporter substrate-binding protein DctP n=1 Tax=Variovorax sp. KK3 TaxID=1855728 RepID=UPI00097CB8CD|nr:TRAP transporter substrate-binding protein DctP [Variovorax sp. KK3]
MPLTLQEERERCSAAEAWLRGAYAKPLVEPPQGAPVVMRASAHPPADAWVVPNVFQPSFTVLNTMSTGRIAVTAAWGESAHPAREGFQALVDGRTDFAACYTSWEPERFPLAQLLALPKLFPDTEVATAASEALYEPFLRDEFERAGVLLGRLKATGAYHLFARRPIERLADVRGLKIGTNAGIDSRIAAALGGQPVPLRSVDLLPAFLGGDVDLVSLADGSAQVFGIGRHAAARMEIGVSMMNLEFGLARRFHDALPGDLRVVLNDWLRAQSQAEAQYFYGVGGAIAREGFAAAGCRFVTLDAEDARHLDACMDQLTDDIANELDARGLPARDFVRAARAAAEALHGRSANALMLDAIERPRWLLPGTRAA